MRLKGNLMAQIFIAFGIAIILGVIFGPSIEVIKPLGDLFLRLIKFIIAPLILASLVVGVASTGDPKQLGRIGVKTVSYYLVTSAIAVAIGLAFAYLISPGKGVNISVPEAAAQVNETDGVIATLLNIIPENSFTALSSGNIL
ncbi:DAACS family dicarboxylate/amino acid:sodium (Na+) or proton (H+) symporter [Sporosarcina newyorkensis 2681]|nr:DAACS family dicarboxylate/amino acid:sodium (Na+) or proton (H+) symporter [Sporosarcina newyorkensis 2681]